MALRRATARSQGIAPRFPCPPLPKMQKRRAVAQGKRQVLIPHRIRPAAILHWRFKFY